MRMINRRSFLGMAGLCGAGLLCGLLPAQAACAAAGQHTQTRVMMGTIVSLTADGMTEAQAQDAFARTFETMCQLENIFSRHDSATPLSELNRAGRLRDCPPELLALTERALGFGRLTAGAFDITVQPVVDFYQRNATPQGEMQLDAAELTQARALVGQEHVRTEGKDIVLSRHGMGLTLDGIAKGHIADCASQLLTACGVVNHLVNAGGDIMARGAHADGRPWCAGIADPAAGDQNVNHLADALPLRNRALATSGSYEIFYDASRRHHHLITPSTGGSPAVGSVSVLAASALEADALATGLASLPPQDALRLVDSLPGRECRIILPDGKNLRSRGWPAA